MLTKMLSINMWNILKNPNAVEYKSIVESIAMEKGFMTECCDSVIAVADHSYQTLVKEYSIPLEKLKIIKNIHIQDFKMILMWT